MLPLSKADIARISQIVREHFTALSIRVLGKDAFPSDVVKDLTRRGVLSSSAAAELDLIRDPYLLGFIQKAVAGSGTDPRDISRSDFNELLRTIEPPLSPVEEAAVARAKMWAGEKITTLGNRMTDSVLSSTRAVEGELLLSVPEIVKDATATAVAQRGSAHELESMLKEATQDFETDWLRTATTEIHEAHEHGVAHGISSQFGSSAKVAKIPSPAACPSCLRLYTEGGKPRIFTLSKLMRNGSNKGKKKADWKATLDPLHPYCECFLVHVPEGFEFNDEGDLVPSES